MNAIGLLVTEHRLIERMVALLSRELEREGKEGRADLVLIRAAVEFFRTYADMTHHGKEEDILFRELAMKQLSPEHRGMLDRLFADHAVARENVKALYEAAARYGEGDMGALAEIGARLKNIVALYPPHIELEDRRFFVPVMAYFSEEERKKMYEECLEFDRKMIHLKYARVVEECEGK